MSALEVFCSFDHCENLQLSRGYCSGHYQQFVSGVPLRPLKQRNKGKSCGFDGCDREAHAKGYCTAHARQLSSGKPLKPIRSFGGAGWHKNSAGYVIRKIRGSDGKLVTVFQHREVMERMLGRPLLKNENVHHKNGVKDDNSTGNLELWVKSQPSGQRAVDLVKWARQILDTYEKDVNKL